MSQKPAKREALLESWSWMKGLWDPSCWEAVRCCWVGRVCVLWDLSNNMNYSRPHVNWASRTPQDSAGLSGTPQDSTGLSGTLGLSPFSRFSTAKTENPGFRPELKQEKRREETFLLSLPEMIWIPKLCLNLICLFVCLLLLVVIPQLKRFGLNQLSYFSVSAFNN